MLIETKTGNDCGELTCSLSPKYRFDHLKKLLSFLQNNQAMKKIYFLIIVSTFCLSKIKAQATDTLNITVYGSPSSSSEYNATGYTINGQPAEYNFCTAAPSIAIAIIDSASCQ